MSFEPYPYTTPSRPSGTADGYPEPSAPVTRSSGSTWYDSHGFAPRSGDGTYPSSGNDGVGALVCGILSLFVCGVVLGPVAIHLAGQSDSGAAKAGKVLGILGLVFGVLGILLGLAQLAGS